MAMSSPVTRDDIRAAAERIDGRVRRTPVLSLERGAFGADASITLKLEQLQLTGSFKPRGAYSKILASDVPPAGVIAASGGNFGLAVAAAARDLGHRAEIFVPATSPAAKIDRIRERGAHVQVIDGLYDDAADACRLRASETGACWMHPYDQPEVVAGQGTVGLELSEQLPGAHTLLVGVGGGGLIGGIAAWYGSSVRVVGVEPEGSRCLDAALAAGAPVDVPVESVAADSLGAKRVGSIAFAVARRHVDHVSLVPDDAIIQAQRTLWRELRVVAEPGGAAAFAALTTGVYRPEAAEHVVVLICGANCEPSTVAI